MTASFVGTHWALPSPSTRGANGHIESEGRLGRCSAPVLRRSVSFNGVKVHASASTVSADTAKAASPRPPCYQEVWVAPGPSMLIKDKRAFTEEHRFVFSTIWHLAPASPSVFSCRYALHTPDLPPLNTQCTL